MDARDAITAALVAQAMSDEDQGNLLGTSPLGGFMFGGTTPTDRDMFDNSAVGDWGGVFSPDPTLGAPAMTAQPNTTPTFDIDKGGMPPAPTFDFNAPGYTPAAPTPAAPPDQGGSLTDPGLGGMGAVAGMGDLGLGDFGGFGGSADADNTGGSSGVG